MGIKLVNLLGYDARTWYEDQIQCVSNTRYNVHRKKHDTIRLRHLYKKFNKYIRVELELELEVGAADVLLL